ncbi:hypothetical protein [Micromonospora sp. HUAS LYJ1]|uniref:hypothetical protein n=1 Tax=Micromonospora sp. HUAS LYJ1 TaxID=3061626 RepID=UPI002670F55B|nr:hypothetical protein [Micromonospora sp. HUAS LYJ1]WKU02756.1 hypothetical protein Q2K16_17735 [Micromonospora sp. HUAS LYJ1]
MGVDRGGGDRLRGAVLAGAALLALGGGGWWWSATAPAVDPVGSAATVSPQPSVGAEATRRVVVIDARTGRVLGATELPGTSGDPDVGLPTFTDTTWRERMTLVSGRAPVRRESAPDGARHLFQYRCSGDGTLLISVLHDDPPQHRRTACDGELVAWELRGPDGGTRLEFSVVGPGSVELEAQVVAVP